MRGAALTHCNTTTQCEERRTLIFSAPSDEERSVWIRQLSKAALLHVPSDLDFRQYYASLGVQQGTCSERQLRLAYRKQALIHHPDKGGLLDDFKVSVRRSS